MSNKLVYRLELNDQTLGIFSSFENMVLFLQNYRPDHVSTVQSFWFEAITLDSDSGCIFGNNMLAIWYEGDEYEYYEFNYDKNGEKKRWSWIFTNDHH
jgi:hypothetical protein